ncbi:MAG: slipin family protein [FCB group bacterium]|nr:slipin family protein [FCB group bacterium]
MTTVYVIIALVVLVLASAIRVLKEWERGIVLRLGRFTGASKGPGLIILIPLIDQLTRVNIQDVVFDVPPQDVITKDNVSVKVNAVITYRVLDPDKAIINVVNYPYAISQHGQTTLRSVLGGAELDELLSERDKLNHQIQELLDIDTDPWGIKVKRVEIKHVDLPQEMQRSMAKQAEAERERRAKVIAAEGEFQASHRLAEAAENLEKHPTALQLRFLQTLAEVATENNSTTIFPVPVDFLSIFMKKYTDEASRGKQVND